MHRQIVDGALYRWELERSIRIVSGVSSQLQFRPSSSESRETVEVALSPVREVRNVLRKMRYIHARKFVPNWKDENPFKPWRRFLNQILGLFAILGQPVREIIEPVEERHCEFFERIGLSALRHAHKIKPRCGIFIPAPKQNLQE